jgi:hypothetical protein
MNSGVWEVTAGIKLKVVADGKEEAERAITEHLRQHPERLEVKSKFITPCEVLEKWEVGGQ